MTEKSGRMPRCLGAFEVDDPQCDGNPVGKTDRDRMPCAYRDRCAGFQMLMKAESRPREYFVRTIGTKKSPTAKEITYTFALDDGFEHQVNEQILIHGIQSGRPTLDRPMKLKVVRKKPSKVTNIRKPTKAVARAGAKGRAKQSEQGKDKSRLIGQWLVKRIATRLGRKVAAFEESARPGELFLVDRLETSNYCTLACKARGRKIAILSFMLKPNKELIEVRAAVSFEAFQAARSSASKKEFEALDHTGKDGAFKVRFRDVDNECASVIAETLAKMDKSKLLGLPEKVEE
jgi:hypothetical protein